MMVRLYAPEQYWRLPQPVKVEITNGCGTGGWKGKLVPDRLFFLNIKDACDIHDYMYHAGETIEDKEAADRAFLNNMLRLIDAAGGPWLIQSLRRWLAHRYYKAVHLFGGPAFWSDKNPLATFGEVPCLVGMS